MEWEQSKIIQRNSAVHAEQEINHQSKFDDHIWR